MGWSFLIWVIYLGFMSGMLIEMLMGDMDIGVRKDIPREQKIGTLVVFLVWILVSIVFQKEILLFFCSSLTFILESVREFLGNNFELLLRPVLFEFFAAAAFAYGIPLLLIIFLAPPYFIVWGLGMLLGKLIKLIKR